MPARLELGGHATVQHDGTDGEGFGQRPHGHDLLLYLRAMVFIWRSGGSRRRRRRPSYGYGYGGPGYSRGSGPPRGYGYRGVYGGDGGCLRDLLLINAGCCLANLFGCGPEAVLLAPATVRQVRRSGTGERGTRLADRMIAAVRMYQREISPKRPPSCHFTPTCSSYAVEALERHGARRGFWLTLRRLARCRPGAVHGADPVPA
jgi:putative membrane protein insertion efficiency factor